MKFVIILLLFLSKVNLAGDTLKFGKSYPLKKVPTYFNTDDYESHVSIPSEYDKTRNELKIKVRKLYKVIDTNIQEELMVDGTTVIVSLGGSVDTLNIDTLNNEVYLKYFTDTLFFKKENFKNFMPFIKTKTGHQNFYDFHIVSLKHGVKQNYIIKNYTSGKPFDALLSYEYDIAPQLIIDELYYRKKDAVYKLNCQFVIIVN